ncbi:L-serine ammonia-lyase, iron-sulfur-dependent, subunit beta [Hymenobacter lapidiphilus]|uniref:L-serine ammonia-lyase, iron-sulfur-dependent subunit beta n=1 Tax=Hymenobacter sp. CCM 8763 TaxID=2303334 RepID=UPI000E3417F7|nr:L-serine ammonia-lyase, iron-sulfur-dependent subunit beta [Hymenobacter sp. CCM 8763]RFP65140.1 L-serine ammonia-lyase, iron-sulfur-dependent, subunit beta [Hymenobacter sp. CCM 8763]
MAEKSSIFDMIGPVMIGPSSSHTAGVVRIARAAIRILGSSPTHAVITFYNSFARTYEGHGSDRAIVAGLLGMNTDDVRIREAFDHAKEAGLSYTFQGVGNASTMHPNTIRLQLRDERTGGAVEVVGQSRGGGVIRIVEVDGFPADFSASLHTLIIDADDEVGSIAFIASVISRDDCNIATMSVSRRGKHETARQFIEMDSDLRPSTLDYLRQLRWVHRVIDIQALD